MICRDNQKTEESSVKFAPFFRGAVITSSLIIIFLNIFLYFHKFYLQKSIESFKIKNYYDSDVYLKKSFDFFPVSPLYFNVKRKKTDKSDKVLGEICVEYEKYFSIIKR